MCLFPWFLKHCNIYLPLIENKSFLWASSHSSLAFAVKLSSSWGIVNVLQHKIKDSAQGVVPSSTETNSFFSISWWIKRNSLLSSLPSFSSILPSFFPVFVFFHPSSFFLAFVFFHPSLFLPCLRFLPSFPLSFLPSFSSYFLACLSHGFCAFSPFSLPSVPKLLLSCLTCPKLVVSICCELHTFSASTGTLPWQLADDNKLGADAGVDSTSGKQQTNKQTKQQRLK